jgi:hypothetical protein
MIAILLASAALVTRADAEPRRASVVHGLDHIAVAVSNLEAAAQTYRGLGFVLKPGRPHENGIRNQHVKFPGGAEIELITAPELRDGLTMEYRRHLEGGDGPAFVALYTPDLEAVASRTHDGVLRDGLVTFPPGDPLRYIFFGRRNESPTDRPEHFAHPNGAVSLVSVWLASDDFTEERRLFDALHVPIVAGDVVAPRMTEAEIAHLDEGVVVMLPRSEQIVPGRKIIGATLEVRDLGALIEAFSPSARDAHSWVGFPWMDGVLLPPGATHGLWLEFRERRGAE